MHYCQAAVKQEEIGECISSDKEQLYIYLNFP